MRTQIPTKDLSHEEWLMHRQEGIGSSDVPIILGLSKYTTPYELWLEKLADTPTEHEDNLRMKRGRQFEEFVARLYMEDTGHRVQRDRKIRLHPDFPFMRCNLDRAILPVDHETTWGILEIKVTSAYVAKAWVNEIPPEFYTQIQHQLFVTGWTWAVNSLLIDGYEHRTFFIKRDNEQIERQNKPLFHFWNTNVLKRVPPSKTVKDYELAISKPESITYASVDIIAACAELRELKRLKKDLEIQQARYEDKIKRHIGEHEILVDEENVLATWKTFEQRRLDINGLKVGQPEIYERYSKSNPSRRFNIK